MLLIYRYIYNYDLGSRSALKTGVILNSTRTTCDDAGPYSREVGSGVRELVRFMERLALKIRLSYIYIALAVRDTCPELHHIAIVELETIVRSWVSLPQVSSTIYLHFSIGSNFFRAFRDHSHTHRKYVVTPMCHAHNVDHTHHHTPKWHIIVQVYKQVQ